MIGGTRRAPCPPGAGGREATSEYPSEPSGAVSHVAAVDIGGTKIAAGRVDADGALSRVRVVPTPATDGPEAILRTVAGLVRELGPVHAIGVGSGGVIDPRTGTVRSATSSLPGWTGTDIRTPIGDAFGVPVAVDNDVQAHALGEHWTGTAQGSRILLFVAVGTGVGAAVLLDGQVHRGAHGAAGHVGHVPTAAAVGRRCPCGATGHVEAVASGPAMLDEYRSRTSTSGDDLRHVAEMAARGDRTAAAVIDRGARALGSTLGGIANVLDPDAIVIGGSVPSCGDRWWAGLNAGLEAELLPALGGLAAVPAALGADAALVGAGRMAWTTST